MSARTAKQAATVTAVEPEIIEAAPLIEPPANPVVKAQAIGPLGAGQPSRQPEPGMVAIIERRHGTKLDRSFSYTVVLVSGVTSEGIVTEVCAPALTLKRGQWTNIVVDLGCRVPEPSNVLFHLRDQKCKPMRFNSVETALHAIKGAVSYMQKAVAWKADQPRRKAQWKKAIEEYTPPFQTERENRERF